MARWEGPCTLMGCTAPCSRHDHHYLSGHLDVHACQCAAQTGEPGSRGGDR